MTILEFLKFNYEKLFVFPEKLVPVTDPLSACINSIKDMNKNV